MSAPGKQYGLILSKKKEAQVMPSKPSVFESDSDSDEEENKKAKKNVFSKQPKLKTQLEIKKVLEEDPTAYEYDSVYDAMKERKEAALSESVVDRKPKYIQTLLKAADKRKKEYERRVERKIQIEREEEGEKFADKEAFVTSAYKKKMQELQEEEEKEKRMDAIEALMDVTKQKDLSGFYRHLLKKQTSHETSSELKEKEVKKEKSSSSEDERSSNSATKSTGISLPTSGDDSLKSNNKTQNKAREIVEQLRQSDRPNNTVDADSDFTSDSESSSSDSADSDIQSKESKGKHGLQADNGRKRKISSTSNSNKTVENEHNISKSSRLESEDKDDKSESSSDSDDAHDHVSSKNKDVKPVLSDKEKLKALFAKRTVGDKFIAAQERYWQRRAQRVDKLAETCA